MQGLSHLSDAALLRELHALVGSHRRVTAQLILHLGEVDTRRLHVEKGFPSLFAYCVRELSFSEDEACRRIDAARLARRFPTVLSLLETGVVSLTVLGLLGPHLTEANHRELLAAVSGASVRQAKESLAALFPLPDVPSSIRKLPERSRLTAFPGHSVPALDSTLPAPTRVPATAHASGVPSAAVPSAVPMVVGAQSGPVAASTTAPAVLVAQQAPRARVEPLSADRFLVKLTVNRALRDKLELARDLMRHANPGGDLSVIVERAVDLLIADLEKKRKGKTTRPRQTPRPAQENARDSLRPSRRGDARRLALFVRGGRRAALRGAHLSRVRPRNSEGPGRRLSAGQSEDAVPSTQPV